MTLVASAAIGFGVALARAGAERRESRGRSKLRRLGLQRDERLTAGLARMALEQADTARAQLARAEGGDAQQAVHETRKAIKRLRTIVRLLEGELGSSACAREQDALRAAAQPLAGARDAEVMASTLEALVARNRKRLSRRPGVLSLRLQLAEERERAERQVLTPANRWLVGNELRLFRARAERWQLGDSTGIGAVEQGLRRVYRQGRRRFRRASAKHGPETRTMHQWRKRVKDLRYAAELLQLEKPSRAAQGAGRARAGAKRLRRLGERADALAELLGEEHDLAVLGEWIAAHGAAAGAGRGTRRLLEKLIASRRAKLRKRSLRAGRELYARAPERFMRRIGTAFMVSSGALSRR